MLIAGLWRDTNYSLLHESEMCSSTMLTSTHTYFLSCYMRGGAQPPALAMKIGIVKCGIIRYLRGILYWLNVRGNNHCMCWPRDGLATCPSRFPAFFSPQYKPGYTNFSPWMRINVYGKWMKEHSLPLSCSHVQLSEHWTLWVNVT